MSDEHCGRRHGYDTSRFSAEETTWAAARILRAWSERCGVPRALYTDWKNVYKRKPIAKEELEGTVPVSQFGQMCARLGIEIMAANSPQACLLQDDFFDPRDLVLPTPDHP